MSTQFALRCGIDGSGELTLFEQNAMTAEERGWWYRKLEKVAEARNKKTSSTPSMPNLPHIPHR